jgi:hypothetical protein
MEMHKYCPNFAISNGAHTGRLCCVVCVCVCVDWGSGGRADSVPLIAKVSSVDRNELHISSNSNPMLSKASASLCVRASVQ